MNLTKDCSLPAPLFYRTVMHIPHLISFPTYITTLIILFRDHSRAFHTYKYYIIFHIIMNMVSEFYVSFLMLPVTYLPFLIIRTTGYLSDFGFSGISQWYVLATLVMLSVASVCQMFDYRYKVSVLHNENQELAVFLSIAKWFIRALIIGQAVFGAITLEQSIKRIGDETAKLVMEYPSLLPAEVTCYSTVMSIFDDYINITAMTVYGICFVVSITSCSSCLISIISNLRKNTNLSKTTIRLQTMFIFSLCVQSGVHGVLLGIPCAGFVIGRFVVTNLNHIALGMMVCVAYHGFFSTVAMIAFTKPIRDRMTRRKKVRQDSIAPITQLK